MIHITAVGDVAQVQFTYDTEAVDIIRSINGRRWMAKQRWWDIPASEVNLTARRFNDAGFAVFVNGKTWTPPYTANDKAPATETPLTAFYRSLPTPLREPVYKALVRVLHPDTGGDVRLAQELNQARDRWPA